MPGNYLSLDELGKKLVISVEQAANLLSMSRQGAYDAFDRGDLPGLRMGRRKLVLARELYRMITGSYPTGSAS